MGWEMGWGMGMGDRVLLLEQPSTCTCSVFLSTRVALLMLLCGENGPCRVSSNDMNKLAILRSRSTCINGTTFIFL